MEFTCSWDSREAGAVRRAQKLKRLSNWILGIFAVLGAGSYVLYLTDGGEAGFGLIHGLTTFLMGGHPEDPGKEPAHEEGGQAVDQAEARLSPIRQIQYIGADPQHRKDPQDPAGKPLQLLRPADGPGFPAACKFHRNPFFLIPTYHTIAQGATKKSPSPKTGGFVTTC